MKHTYIVSLFLCLSTTSLSSQSHPVSSVNQNAEVVSPIIASRSDRQDRTKLWDHYGSLPLSFEANHGQADARVKFLSRDTGYSLFLTGDEAILALGSSKVNGTLQPELVPPADGSVLRMKLRNAEPGVRVTGEGELPGTKNYFIGSDPTKWHSHISTYARVKYEGIYPGIDMVYYGNHRQLEYDFIVAPGADPRRIQFDVRGAKHIHRAENGDLVLKMGESEIRWRKPIVYQEYRGSRHEIASRYVITDKRQVAFEIADYDRTRPLFIDPIVYSTFLGGSSQDIGMGIAVDREGNAYVTGWTYSVDFPNNDAIQLYRGVSEAFVAKINPSGSALIYSTYLGGTGGEVGCGISVDREGNAYIGGYTYSDDFPTVNPIQPARARGYDAFIAKLDPSGSALVYSTYLGGSEGDDAWGIATDSDGNAYLVGRTDSPDFPTKNPLQAYGGGMDAFIAKINPSGSALVFSTFLGGSGDEIANTIAVDSSERAHVAGITYSANFPTKNALQSYNGGSKDAFVLRLNPSGSQLSYSTYLGGGGPDDARGLAVDCHGNAYVSGSTSSSDFPTKNALQPVSGGYQDAFAAKLNQTGTALVYSTYLGGSSTDTGWGIAADCTGNAYITGTTFSFNFPTASPIQRGKRRWDAFVTKINSAGSAFYFSSFLGGSGDDQGYGIAVDDAGYAYITGSGGSSDFPSLSSLQGYGGGGDAFVAKIAPVAWANTSITSLPNPSVYGQPVTVTARVTSGAGAPPDGEAVTFKQGPTTLGTGLLASGSASIIVSPLKAGTISFKAVYGGDSDFAASTSKAANQVVNKATTTTSLSSSQNPSVSGQPVVLTATVTPQSGDKVTGKVTFYDGPTVLKTVWLNASPMAKFTTSSLTPGTHSITATYSGSSNFNSSFVSLMQSVK